MAFDSTMMKYLALSVEYLLLNGHQFSCSILCNFYLLRLTWLYAAVATW